MTTWAWLLSLLIRNKWSQMKWKGRYRDRIGWVCVVRVLGLTRYPSKASHLPPCSSSSLKWSNWKCNEVPTFLLWILSWELETKNSTLNKHKQNILPATIPATALLSPLYQCVFSSLHSVFSPLQTNPDDQSKHIKPLATDSSSYRVAGGLLKTINIPGTVHQGTL